MIRKLKKIFTVHSNIPHGVGFGNLLKEFVTAVKADSQAVNSDESASSESEGPQEQITSPLALDSQITLNELFKAVATGVAANASIRTNELPLRYRILQNDPLLIESSNVKERQSDPTIDTVVSPKWCLYIETKDRAWNISAFPSGDDLQRKLLDICGKRLTHIAVPFHNLKVSDKFSLTLPEHRGDEKIQ